MILYKKFATPVATSMAVMSLVHRDEPHPHAEFETNPLGQISRAITQATTTAMTYSVTTFGDWKKE